jgi:hypothetical protein
MNSASVRVVLFRGRPDNECPYLRFGHAGLQFHRGGPIYGFGPASVELSLGGSVKRGSSAAFSDHTDVFRRAELSGLDVFSFSSVLCVARDFERSVGVIVRSGYELPRSRGGFERGVGPTNCVGALRRLGVEMPGCSVYIRDLASLPLPRLDTRASLVD